MRTSPLVYLTAGFLVWLLLSACGDSSSAAQQDTTSTITVRNPASTARTDELIVIPRADLPAVADGQIVILRTPDGTIPPQQTDDLDGDGEWDEIAVLADLEAGASLSLAVTTGQPADLPQFPRRASFRMSLLDGEEYKNVKTHTRPAGHKAHDPLYHVEGASWENDRIGFRNYFDERNGKDIFGKRVPGMVLDTVSLGSNYHELGDWGMDILKVGNSLGAGALAVKVDDRLYRLGPTTTASYREVANGPIRAIGEFTYTGWAVAGHDLTLTERITMTPGNNYYKSEVTVSGYPSEITLVTGIVNMQSEEMIYDFPEGAYTAFATWDRQSYIEDGLGMAIILRADALAANRATPDEGEGIIQTYYGEIPLSPGETATYYFVAGWETADPAFGSREGFLALVNGYLSGLSQPITVSQKTK